MENFQDAAQLIAFLTPLFVVLAIWDGIWRLIAMWKAGRNNELAWFICLAIFSTVGILPIIYILISKNKKSDSETSE